MDGPIRVAGVIPARWGSTRLPGKSLVAICGKPLIRWVIEGARKARRLDALIVATDDGRIASAARAAGADAVMTRADHPSGTDRVAEAVAGTGAELVVNIQGDEPMIDAGLIDRLVEAMLEAPEWDMGTAAAPIADPADLRNPSVVKVVRDACGGALYFSRAAIPHIRDEGSVDWRGLYRRHLGLYAYRCGFLSRLVATPPCATELAEKLEQLRALHIGGRIVVLEAEGAGIGVDTPADVPHVEAELRRRGMA